VGRVGRDAGTLVGKGAAVVTEHAREHADIEDAAATFDLVAGATCLDFTNTVGGRRDGDAREHLLTYADLVRWGQQAGLIGVEGAGRLTALARAQPDDAEAVLRRAVALREALYRIFMARLAGADPAAADLAVLNAELAQAHRHMVLAATADGFGWQWAGDEGALDAVLWPVARSAADLLLAPACESVRQCASETCGWLFIDATRNHSRHWCDMRSCGNRAKVRRHRARQHGDARA
jgi:predicted RNA-binding Zn ribbon-like protein